MVKSATIYDLDLLQLSQLLDKYVKETYSGGACWSGGMVASWQCKLLGLQPLELSFFLLRNFLSSITGT